MKKLLEKLKVSKATQLLCLAMISLAIGAFAATSKIILSPTPETWANSTNGNYFRITAAARLETRYAGKTNVGIGTNVFTGFTGSLPQIQVAGSTQAVALHVVNGLIVGTNTYGE